MEGNILKEWFLNINYNPYKIPTDDKFKFLCQGKIGPIWQEVINVFESRKKVDKIRLNLIYHGLKNNLKSTDLKPKQVELWNRKIELEGNLYEIKQKIKETEKRLNAEVHNGKLKC
ncbi:uncharacterized protein LOC123295105 [Chrysoperla carnea]|uniref:uncharacterized protein LOC123295105 n=1 Tax=Chrysoperla carnea TaxID=189513 RepID=UPI001D062C29|nr:uncharacterized protein LOC123295105 [Chrysoperla carnea]